MLDRVLDFLGRGKAPAAAQIGNQLELAVAALMIEAARMDETFDADERSAIEALLARKFNLPPTRVHQLVEAAEKVVHDTTQYFPFTREICNQISPEDRIHIVEMLWQVAYADGVLDPHEDMLVRKLSGLIHVPDRERAIARQRALEKLAAERVERGETN